VRLSLDKTDFHTPKLQQHKRISFNAHSIITTTQSIISINSNHSSGSSMFSHNTSNFNGSMFKMGYSTDMLSTIIKSISDDNAQQTGDHYQHINYHHDHHQQQQQQHCHLYYYHHNIIIIINIIINTSS
jgi:hypothetical protein